MRITSREVVEELARRGYVVSERRLVDWRQRNLLPGLDQRGLGRARGKTYTWPSSAVCDQVIAVLELLRRVRKASRVYLPLWLLGFEVPVARVRENLASPLARILAGIAAGAQLDGNIEDFLFNVVTDAAPELSEHLGADEVWACDIGLLTSKAMFAGNSFVAREDVQRVNMPDDGDDAIPEAFREHPLPFKDWAFVARTFSVPVLHAALTTLPDDELRLARDDVQRAAAFLRARGCDAAVIENRKYEIAVVLGGLCFVLALALRGSPLCAAYQSFVDEVFRTVDGS
jgi:hypothetical protein